METIPIEVRFHQAAYYVGNYDGPDAPSPTDDQKLAFYGLYKQSTKVRSALHVCAVTAPNCTGMLGCCCTSLAHTLVLPAHRVTAIDPSRPCSASLLDISGAPSPARFSDATSPDVKLT